MENALIVTCTEKSMSSFAEILSAASTGSITPVYSCGDARRLLLEREFDLVVINAPLRDETGESLARELSSGGVIQVILAVRSELFDAVSAVCEDDGVLVVAKPLHKALFWSALKLARSAEKRLLKIQAENIRLKQTIADIRIINGAKCILISYHGMSEQEAHRYIEKHAMDLRLTKRKVAEEIISAHESRQLP